MCSDIYIYLLKMKIKKLYSKKQTTGIKKKQQKEANKEVTELYSYNSPK